MDKVSCEIMQDWQLILHPTLMQIFLSLMPEKVTFPTLGKTMDNGEGDLAGRQKGPILSETVCRTVALSLCDTLGVSHCGTLGLWDFGSLALWECGSVRNAVITAILFCPSKFGCRDVLITKFVLSWRETILVALLVKYVWKVYWWHFWDKLVIEYC